jgi:hypothetical protein
MRGKLCFPFRRCPKGMLGGGGGIIVTVEQESTYCTEIEIKVELEISGTLYSRIR